jgi:hypothetical protein
MRLLMMIFFLRLDDDFLRLDDDDIFAKELYEDIR